LKESNYLIRRLCTRSLIEEPLAFDAAQYRLSPLAIRHLPLVVAEIKLGQIAMQVLLAAMLVDAFMPRLKIEKKPSTVFV